MSYQITIGGLEVGGVKFQWALTSGVKPETQVVQMARGRADRIYALGLGPHELKMADRTYAVYLLDIVPGPSPLMQRTTLSFRPVPSMIVSAGFPLALYR